MRLPWGRSWAISGFGNWPAVGAKAGGSSPSRIDVANRRRQPVRASGGGGDALACRFVPGGGWSYCGVTELLFTQLDQPLWLSARTAIRQAGLWPLHQPARQVSGRRDRLAGLGQIAFTSHGAIGHPSPTTPVVAGVGHVVLRRPSRLLPTGGKNLSRAGGSRHGRRRGRQLRRAECGCRGEQVAAGRVVVGGEGCSRCLRSS